jgi:hypothetical protein
MLSVLLVCGLASAQEIGAPPALPEAPDVDWFAEEAEPAPEEIAGPAQAEEDLRSKLHALEAASFYQVGLELVIQRAFDEASAIFLQITEQYSDTEFLEFAREQLDALELLTESMRERDLLSSDSSRIAMSGMTELAISQGLAMPVILGLLVPGSTFQPEEPLVPVSLGMAGIGVGVGGAYLLDRVRPVDTQTAMAIFTGEWIGALNGLAISAAWPPRGYRGLFAETLAGTVIGGGLGYAANLELDPTPGGIAAINSGALWGTYIALMSEVFLYSETDREMMLRTMAGLDFGALLGGGIGWKFQPSRQRVNIVTLSGVAGTAIGGGVAILGAWYGSIYDEGAAAIVMGGSIAGLLGGAYLSGRIETVATAGVFSGKTRLQITPLVLPEAGDSPRVLGLRVGATGW